MQIAPAPSPLVHQAHIPLRGNSAFSRQPARQACRKKPNPLCSTADDIRAATRAWQEHIKQQGIRQTGTVAPDAADEAAQRRLQEIAQAVQIKMAPGTTSETSMNMTYEDILNRDHDMTGGHVDDMHGTSKKSVKDVQKPAQGQDSKPVKAPLVSLMEFMIRTLQGLQDPVGVWTRASLREKASYCIVGPVVIFACLVVFLVAAVVLYLALCQTAKFMLSCAIGMTHPHTWLIISGLTVIALITPQAPKLNGLLRFVDDFNLFANYGQAKHAISMVTWSSIAIFLLFVFFVGSV
ncbi:hypothetical protein ABBQ32_007121 [Trebouxia sp. C0010 RCD-2024]